ncbi:hypothetical protein PVAP13_3KG203127 [Panicum virgatum]|uniref:Uncharacterized protein n=1 Tax=Panicum virgatum TaxID=38727 RepID=A0A8T0UVQ9_PANVG|nr:hypothetical protein PVAP13_3KG203127 [Panicum virgatum]
MEGGERPGRDRSVTDGPFLFFSRTDGSVSDAPPARSLSEGRGGRPAIKRRAKAKAKDDPSSARLPADRWSKAKPGQGQPPSEQQRQECCVPACSGAWHRQRNPTPTSTQDSPLLRQQRNATQCWSAAVHDTVPCSDWVMLLPASV